MKYFLIRFWIKFTGPPTSYVNIYLIIVQLVNAKDEYALNVISYLCRGRN